MTSAALTVTAHSARLTLWRNRKLLYAQSFSDDAPSRGELSEQLRALTNTPLSVVVNVREEEFQFEELPHTNGSERKQFWRRKQEQLLPTAVHRCTIKQGRSANGPKDILLFAGLTGTSSLQQWLAPIIDHKVPLRGIYSLPIICESLVKRLKLSAGPALFVSRHNETDIRQSYFFDGKLKFTRLLSGLASAANDTTQTWAAEINGVRRHLENQSLLPRNETLPVHFLSDSQVLNEKESLIAVLPQCECHFVSIYDAVRQARLSTQNNSIEDLFAELVIRHRPKHNFARADERVGWNDRRRALMLYCASLVLAVTGFAISANQLTGGLALDQKTATLRDTHHQLKQQLAATPLPPSAANDNPTDLQQVISAARALSDPMKPATMMHVVSNALAAHPQIQLNGFHWSITDRAKPQPDEYEFDSTKPLSNSNTPFGPTPKSKHQIALLRGEVIDFDQDWRLAMQSVKHFSESLRAIEQIEHVGTVRLPINTDSKQFLSGRVQTNTEGSPDGESAHFILRVILNEGV